MRSELFVNISGWHRAASTVNDFFWWAASLNSIFFCGGHGEQFCQNGRSEQSQNGRSVQSLLGAAPFNMWAVQLLILNYYLILRFFAMGGEKALPSCALFRFSRCALSSLLAAPC